MLWWMKVFAWRLLSVTSALKMEEEMKYIRREGRLVSCWAGSEGLGVVFVSVLSLLFTRSRPKVHTYEDDVCETSIPFSGTLTCDTVGKYESFFVFNKGWCVNNLFWRNPVPQLNSTKFNLYWISFLEIYFLNNHLCWLKIVVVKKFIII